MGKKTGNPRGRPKGALNKASVDFEKKLEEKLKRIEKVLAGAFKGDSHTLLMSVYKDTKMPIATRIDAAKAALPYEKPKLSSVEMKGGLTISHEDALAQLK